MEELFENKVLDELFEMRTDGLERAIIKKYGKTKEHEKADKTEEELTNILKETVKDEKKFEIIFEKINDFEGYLFGEIYFWEKQYYKKGFIDGMYFKKEIQEERKEIEKEFKNEDEF